MCSGGAPQWGGPVFRIPDTTLGIVLEAAASLVFSYVLLSFLEHFIHRNLMHLHKLPKLVYKLVPHFNIVYSDHAVEHHGRFYKEFDWEPDEVGRHVNLVIRVQDSAFMAVAFSPLLALMALFSPILFVSFCAVGAAHNRIWGIIHKEMHIPDDRNFFKRWGVYRFLARHHFMHHVRPLKNMNVVVPFADFVLGSVATPRLRDVKEMLRLGYLLPRTARAKARLEKINAAYAQRRATYEAGAPGDVAVAA
jgi:hypothetical protein